MRITPVHVHTKLAWVHMTPAWPLLLTPLLLRTAAIAVAVTNLHPHAARIPGLPVSRPHPGLAPGLGPSPAAAGMQGRGVMLPPPPGPMPPGMLPAPPGVPHAGMLGMGNALAVPGLVPGLAGAAAATGGAARPPPQPPLPRAGSTGSAGGNRVGNVMMAGRGRGRLGELRCMVFPG